MTTTLPAETRATDPGAIWWRQAVVYQIYPRSFADANGDGNPADARDTDMDGTRDYLDVDDDGDAIDTDEEGADPNGDGDPSDARDGDGDGTPDYLDPNGGSSTGGFAGGACGCRVQGRGEGGAMWLMLGLAIAIVRRRRRAGR